MAANRMMIREMTLADIAGGLRLSGSSGWNQLESDWRVFLERSPRGCRVTEEHGQILGTMATLRYENKFAWISMMLVDPSLRGQGIGTQLFRQALEILHDVPCLRLDATPAGRELYRNFDFTDDYPIYRTKATVPDGSAPRFARRMTDSDLPEVFERDREIFGADRSFLLSALFEGAPEYAWIIPGRGYTFGRYGANCDQLGPVVAEDESAARDLISAHPGRQFYVDTPHADFAKGFSVERSLVRMSRGQQNFEERLDRSFAIAGPEFG